MNKATVFRMFKQKIHFHGLDFLTFVNKDLQTRNL